MDRGRYATTIDLMDTPIGREGTIGILAYVWASRTPATFWQPEDYEEGVDDIEVDKGLTSEEETIVKEWALDNWDEIYDSDYVEWD